MVALRRIKQELLELQQNPIPHCSVEPLEHDLFHWKCVMMGPDDSPYQDGIFVLSIAFPQNYPFQPMKVTMNTPMYHVNVEPFGFGTIGFQLDWNLTHSVGSVLLSIFSLLAEPCLDHVMNDMAAQQYQQNVHQYNEIARDWTMRYAVLFDTVENLTLTTSANQESTNNNKRTMEQPNETKFHAGNTKRHRGGQEQEDQEECVIVDKVSKLSITASHDASEKQDTNMPCCSTRFGILDPATRRIQSEFESLEQGAVPNVFVSLTDPNHLHEWRVMLLGPPGTPYQDEFFFLIVNFPTTYPWDPPELCLEPNPNFPNLARDTVLGHWCPSYSITLPIMSIYSLLAEPDFLDETSSTNHGSRLRRDNSMQRRRYWHRNGGGALVAITSGCSGNDRKAEATITTKNNGPDIDNVQHGGGGNDRKQEATTTTNGPDIDNAQDATNQVKKKETTASRHGSESPLVEALFHDLQIFNNDKSNTSGPNTDNVQDAANQVNKETTANRHGSESPLVKELLQDLGDHLNNDADSFSSSDYVKVPNVNQQTIHDTSGLCGQQEDNDDDSSWEHV